MATSDTKYPTNAGNEVGINPMTWASATNCEAQDNVNTTAGNVTGNVSVKDQTISLRDASGTIFGDNKADALDWLTTYQDFSYGSSTDMWGLSHITQLNPATVNDADFGVDVAVTVNSVASEYLFASGFGYTISSKASIQGINVIVRKQKLYVSRSNKTFAAIDVIYMTVYYDYGYPQIQIISFLAPLLIKLCAGVTATGILSMFGIIKLSYKNGLVVHMAQTRCAGNFKTI